MLSVELPTLISKLNSQTKLALEQAAQLCVSRENPEVTLEHFFWSMLDNPLSDFTVLLNQQGYNLESIRQKIGDALPRETGHDRVPAFSPVLVEALQDAWLLSSTTLDLNDIRSGSLFLATLMRADRYLPLNLIDTFADINRETLRKNFAQLTEKSSETPTDTPQPRATSPHRTDDPIARFCHDMTEQARLGQLDPVLCRDNELNLMIDILCRRRKNNPIIVGDAGVGKSAVAEGLALRIVAKKVPEKLQQTRLLSLDLGLLQAGAAVKGEFEKRLKGIIQHIKASPEPIILFIDEAHTLIGAGNAEGAGDAANLLKPALARGELCAIAATTWKEYKKYFEKDPALSRRFQLVNVEAPSAAQTHDILRGLHTTYENAHGVFIQDDALHAAAHLSDRYLSGRQLPDKAIDVLDTACARIAIALSAPPKPLTQVDGQRQQKLREIALLKRQMTLGQPVDDTHFQQLQAEEQQDQSHYEQLHNHWQQQSQHVQEIIQLRQQLLEHPDHRSDLDLDQSDLGLDKPDATPTPLSQAALRQQLTYAQAQLDALAPADTLLHPQVNAQQIAQVIADWTGIPVAQMHTDEIRKLTQLPDILAQHIQGQPSAITHIHRHLLTARADLRRPGRPNGAFLLVGPSGVGKTETVVQLTEQLYGGREFLTTINLSEYQEKHTTSRLIGSPPGYVGYGEGGILTEAMRKKPYSVVLLDEVEKAHPEVLNLFYQAFDKGELADGEGRVINCQNIVFFMTSNLGYQTIVAHADAPELLEEALYPELAAFFKPALLARMEVVPYFPLTEPVLKQIVTSKLAYLKALLHKRYNATVTLKDALIEEILRRATRSENGARLLESIIEGQVLPELSLQILNTLTQQQTLSHIALDVVDQQFIAQVSTVEEYPETPSTSQANPHGESIL